MASFVQIGERTGVVDKRRNRGSTSSSLATPGNYVSVGALETRLAAANGAYYTTARLRQMTLGDMEYAVRQLDDAAGVK